MTPPTFTPGIHHDLPADEYHAANGVSNSQLKHLNPPARFPVAMATKTEPTPFMRMGTLVHAAILEPDKPFPAITVQPETYPAPATHADVKAGKIAAGEPLKWSNNAKWCKGMPRAVAIWCRARIFSCCAITCASCKKPSERAAREPAGMPSTYFGVSMPCASGLNTIEPMPFSSNQA